MTDQASDHKKELKTYNRRFRDQLLKVKVKLENLQSDFGCYPNFLLLVEDNVTEKINMRGRDSHTAGRILCCGEGSLKEKFCGGKMAFQPDVMSFLQKGSGVQDDPSFLLAWASKVRFTLGDHTTVSRKRVKDEDDQLEDEEMLEPQVLLEEQTDMVVKQEPGDSEEEEKAIEEKGEEEHRSECEKEDVPQMKAKEEMLQIKIEPEEGMKTPQDITKRLKMDPEFTSLSQSFIGDKMQTFDADKMQVGSIRIDPRLVKTASDVRTRDYAVKELVNQAEGGANYSCGLCPFKTFCSKRLSVHVKTIHKFGVKKLVCKECKFVTGESAAMKTHILSVHRKDLLKCQQEGCTYFTFNPEQFRLHCEQHRNNENGSGTSTTFGFNFKCDFCNFKTNCMKGVKIHMNRAHGEGKAYDVRIKQSDSS